MSKWYEMTGEDYDVVVSTRVRLARNLVDFPFPLRMTDQQREQVNRKVRDALLNGNSVISKEFEYLEMDKITPAHAQSMVERHLISPQFAKNRAGKALIMLKDESLSIMLNEEDHIRIQVIKPGLALKEAYALADKIDDLLDASLNYAFEDDLGYLTECPTNLGTGMRASLMLHLPLLETKGALNDIAQTVSKIGLTVRGTYGEGSKARGSLYQFSNQVTLGISESAAIENLESITRQVIQQERALRKAVEQDVRMADRIWRSLGVLSHARTLTASECTDLLSTVRLGVSMGILQGVPLQTIGRLLHEIQPAMIQVKTGRPLTEIERDIKRAEYVRGAIQKQVTS